jgi:homoserine dehydrogenase
MDTYRLALIGFGNVGQGFAQLMKERGATLEQQFGVGFQIVAISDLLRGSVYDPAGLDPGVLLAAVQATGTLDAVPALVHGWSTLRTIEESNAHIIIELSYTDLTTGEPALTHLRRGLESGKHVITTNKGPIALHYSELKALADARGVEIGVEGTVMSGTPVSRFGQELLAASGIERIQGIVNGTTNYILTRMTSGATYATALAEAQVHGYAEADPTGDVEGYDAAAKIVILAKLLMGASLSLSDVERSGITHLTRRDIANAQTESKVWKSVGCVERSNGHVTASVCSICLPMTHPLASVSGAVNALTFTTNLLGDVTIIGPGAGRLETGYALVCDLLAIHRKRTR